MLHSIFLRRTPKETLFGLTRLNQLASSTPGEYFVFDQRTQQIAASLVHASLVQLNSNEF
jgi:hypothetical protein